MSNRRLSLIGMECVLEYMDANQRFGLAQKCPSIQNIDKRIPLHIDFLHLQDYDFIVNGTRYHLEIVQDCPHTTELPDSRYFGIQHDLDQYCLPYNSPYIKVTPGDLVFKEKNPDWDYQRNIIISNREFSLDMMLIELKKRNEGGHLHPLFYSVPTAHLQEKIFEITNLLNDIETETPRHSCKRFLQLTIGPINGSSWEDFVQFRSFPHRRTQRGLYNMPIGMAMKQLTTFLFGGRRHPIHVKTLKIERGLGVLWLPEGLKLKIKNFSSTKGKLGDVCKVVRPILDISN